MLWWNAYETKLHEDIDFFNQTWPERFVNIYLHLKCVCDFSTEDYYKRCRDWLLTAGGRKLWELDMDWGTNESDSQVSLILISIKSIQSLGLLSFKSFSFPSRIA